MRFKWLGFATEELRNSVLTRYVKIPYNGRLEEPMKKGLLAILTLLGLFSRSNFAGAAEALGTYAKPSSGKQGRTNPTHGCG
jgi:hypothetical protein